MSLYVHEEALYVGCHPLAQVLVAVDDFEQLYDVKIFLKLLLTFLQEEFVATQRAFEQAALGPHGQAKACTFESAHFTVLKLPLPHDFLFDPVYMLQTNLMLHRQLMIGDLRHLG